MSKLLVVEDDSIQRRRLTVILRRAGYEITESADGEAALAILAHEDSALVLTDLNLPGLSGPDLIREIHARHPEVPIIAMSAHGDDLLTVQARDAGASAYIPKRAMNSELLDLLDRISSIETRRRDESRVQAGLVETTEYFRIDNDSALVRPLVSRLVEAARRMQVNATQLARLSVALQTALMAAIEQGNLEVERRLQDQDPNAYLELLDIRRPQPPRKVSVFARTSAEGITLVIEHAPGSNSRRGSIWELSQPGMEVVHTLVDKVQVASERLTLTQCNRPRQATADDKFA